jgi:hypothetical protein
MKICVFTAVLILGLSAANGQSQPISAAAARQTFNAAKSDTPQPKIDPVKEADIRQLLDVVGTTRLMSTTMDTMLTSIKPVLTNSLPPGEYRDKLVDLFFTKFKEKADLKEMINLAVPLYDKHFSDQEIKDLIKF